MHRRGSNPAQESHSSCSSPPSSGRFYSPTYAWVPPESRAASPSFASSSSSPSPYSSPLPSPSTSPLLPPAASPSASASSNAHLIFGPGVPVLLEEVDLIVQQQRSSSSSYRSRSRRSESSSCVTTHSPHNSRSSSPTTPQGTNSSSSRAMTSSSSGTSRSSTATSSTACSRSSSTVRSGAIPLSCSSVASSSSFFSSSSSSSSSLVESPSGATVAGGREGSSTSCSTWCTTSTGGHSSSSSCERWTLLPPPVLAASFSVRVCGHAHAFLESVDCFLLRGTFDTSAALLVDISWLSPEVTRSAREGVAAAAAATALASPRRRRRRGTGTAEDKEVVQQHLPLLQFIGEVRPIALKQLNAESRLLLLSAVQHASSSRQLLVPCSNSSDAWFGNSSRNSNPCKSSNSSAVRPSGSRSCSSSTRRAFSRTNSGNIRRVGTNTSGFQSETSSKCSSRCSSETFVVSERCKRRASRDSGSSSSSEGCSSGGSKSVRVRQHRLKRRRCCRAHGGGLLRSESHQEQQEREPQERQREQHHSPQRVRYVSESSAGVVGIIPQALEATAGQREAAAASVRAGGKTKVKNEDVSEKESEEETDEIEDADDAVSLIIERSEEEEHKDEAPTRLRRGNLADKRGKGSGSPGGNVKGEREVVGLLRARVCRQVDGMDMHLYVEALRLFRLLEQQHQAQQQLFYQTARRRQHGPQYEMSSAEARKEMRNCSTEEVLQQHLRLWRQLQPQQQEDEQSSLQRREHVPEERLSEGESREQRRRVAQQEEQQQEAVALWEKEEGRGDKNRLQVGSGEEEYDEEFPSIEDTQRLVST